ncbi:MAG: hypothetical protein BWY65_01854 [Firmicutes bacterium ADurb.Bin373]|nr:MAG: hypothetical protein BWY65_01854 [Firmicutes bacterium ADurb.Bin373]
MHPGAGIPFFCRPGIYCAVDLLMLLHFCQLIPGENAGVGYTISSDFKLKIPRGKDILRRDHSQDAKKQHAKRASQEDIQ